MEDLPSTKLCQLIESIQSGGYPRHPGLKECEDWSKANYVPYFLCMGMSQKFSNHLQIAEMYLHFPSFSYIPFFRAAIFIGGDAPCRDKPAVFTAESARKVGCDVATLHCEEPQEPRRVAVSNFGYGSNLPKNSVMNIAQYQCDLM